MARRGRPPRISREQIVAAAVEVGVDDLRMADVARALDVAPGALYHHVAGREELLALAATQVLEETVYDRWTPAADAPWQEWVRAYAVAFRSALLANAGLLRYVRLSTAATAGRLEQLEQLAAVLTGAGFSLAEVVLTVGHLDLLVGGEVWQRALAGDGAGGPQAAEFDAAVAERAGQLPHLAPLASPDARPDPEARFEFALECLICGLAERLAARDSGPTVRVRGVSESARSPREAPR